MLTLTAWTTNGFLCLCRTVAEPQRSSRFFCFDSASTSLVLFLPAPDETLPLRYCAVFPRCRYAALRQPRCSALQSQPPEQRPAQLSSPSSISAVSALPRQLDASLQQVRHLRCSATPAVANFLPVRHHRPPSSLTTPLCPSPGLDKRVSRRSVRRLTSLRRGSR